ncbi:MAG: GAF domain-containing protein [Planctomycetes bacterium]|nr:GAF domain-containing protein [Planctomycetota bacterium]
MSTQHEDTYRHVLKSIESLIDGETDLISVMSTISCELYHAFEYVNWVGFYRRVNETTLKVGPYQGSHGCLTIDIGRGVCGQCVRDGEIQIENDVSRIPHHIACSSDTKAEIVVPIMNRSGRVMAVLDIDATEVNVFDDVDVAHLKKICGYVARISPSIMPVL